MDSQVPVFGGKPDSLYVTICLTVIPKIMKAISSYLYGFSAASKSFRMITLIYLSYLFIALLVAVPFFGLFQSVAGNRMLPDDLLKGFDATALRELLSGGGKVFSYYIQAFWPWVFVFLLLQVYLNGGILAWISNPRGKFSGALFHRSGRKYFWRFLKLTLYFAIIHLIIALIVYLPYALITGSKTGLTDEQIIRPLIVCVSVHLVILVFIFLLADFTKARIFEQDSSKVFKSIFKCLKITIKRFFPFYFLGLLLGILPVLLFVGFYLIRSALVVDSTGLIIIIFVLQQIMVYARVFLRTWRLAGTYHYYLGISSGS
jgi:hypothetical protein